jgi:trans-aconitate methyltransferase
MVERARVFGSVAEAYESYRPSYPEALVDEVLAHAGLGRGDRALEVGAGTGKASRAFAARGLDLLCLEPDAAMAAVLRRTTPSATVEVTMLERFAPQGRRFRLLYSAQAWHWVDADARARLALEVLEPGGTIALFWNGYEVPAALQDAIDEVYARRAPGVLDEEVHYRTQGRTRWHDELRQAGFVDVEQRDYPGRGELDAAAYVALVGTTSSHLLLDEDVRTPLLDEVEAVIEGHPEPLEIPSGTTLWLGRAPR